MACWVVLGCFLVLACVYCPECGVVGVGACWVGHKRLDEHAHCRVHVQHRVSVRRFVVVVARTASRVYWCGLCVVGCL